MFKTNVRRIPSWLIFDKMWDLNSEMTKDEKSAFRHSFKGYYVELTPLEYLYLTTRQEDYNNFMINKVITFMHTDGFPLSEVGTKEREGYGYMPYLEINIDGVVTGHEGRHRVAAFYRDFGNVPFKTHLKVSSRFEYDYFEFEDGTQVNWREAVLSKRKGTKYRGIHPDILENKKFIPQNFHQDKKDNARKKERPIFVSINLDLKYREAI